MQFRDTARKCDGWADEAELSSPKIAAELRKIAAELRAVDDILAHPA